MAFKVPAREQTKLPVINTLQNLFGHAEITGAEDKKDPRCFVLTSAAPRVGSQPLASDTRGVALAFFLSLY